MSLRKSPTLTCALLAANRRNAKQSTGPRTARGKAWSRLNHLKHGMDSPEFVSFWTALFYAGPGGVRATADELLRAQKVQHPLFVARAQEAVQAEIRLCAEARRELLQEATKKNSFLAGLKPECV